MEQNSKAVQITSPLSALKKGCCYLSPGQCQRWSETKIQNSDKRCHIDGFPGTNVAQSSTADTFGDAERRLPLAGSSPISAANISAYKIPSAPKKSPKILPTEVWP